MPTVRMPDGVVVSFPDTMPPEQIKGLIAQRFPEQTRGKGVLGYIDDAVRSIASGVTFGYADEIAAKMNELTGLGGSYEQNVAQERARDVAIPSAIAIPGQIAGAVGSTLAAAPLAGAAAGTRIAQAASRLPQTLRYAGLGAVEGALAGSGAATEGNRLEGAASGAAVGAPVGALAPHVVRGVAAVGSGIKNAISPQANVAADLGRAIARDADTPLALQQRLAAMRADRPGVATVADVGGENVRGLVERVAQTPGAGRTQVIPALTERQQSQAFRITSDLRSLTGTAKSAKQAIDETIAERAAAAKPLYDDAFNFNARAVPEIVRTFDYVTSTGYGKAILNSGSLRKAIQTEYGIQDIKDAPLMVLIDAWKKQVDDQVGAAVKSGSSNTSRVLTRMRDNVLSVIDKYNPKYAEARNAWAGPSKYLDAVESGRSILSTKFDAEELTSSFAKMSQAEQEGFRIGAVSSIVAKMGNDGAKLADLTKYLRSPETRAKIAAIMPTPEAAKAWMRRLDFEVSASELTGRALGNSATARRLAEQQDAQNLVGDLVMDAITGASAPGLLRKVLGAGPKWLRDTLRSRADARLAEVLTNPQQTKSIDDILRITVTPQRPSALTNAAATAGSVPMFIP